MVTGRTMCKLREFIDSIGNVWLGHRQILKAIDNGTKLRRIGKCNTKLKRQGMCGQKWGGDWSGICHRSSGKKICYKPPLGKDQAERMRKDFNAKKVSQGTHVLEGKPLGK